MSTKRLTAASPAALAHAMIAGQKDDSGAGGGAPDPLLEAIAGIKSDILKTNDGFKESLGTLEKDAGDSSSQFKDFKDGVDTKLTDYNGQMVTLGEKLEELAKKALRVGSGAPEPRKSVGQQVAEFEGIKGFRSGTVEVPIAGGFGQKSITSGATSAGALIDPQRLPGIVQSPDRRLTVRGLLAQGATSANAVEFVREKLFTNNAGVQVAEGDLKAESTLEYELDQAKVATIAHWMAVSKQAMDDAPGLASQVDNRLLYGLAFKEEVQLLKGDGANGNLSGLITEASAFASPIAAGRISSVTNIDVMRIAALQSTVAEYFASGYVLNPIDWTEIELTKDADGRYIIAMPQGQMGATMWNLPVVATNAMDVDNFLTGALSQAVQIFDRESASVMVSTEDRDNFVKNMVTVLAEQRLALATYRPEALTTGTFTDARTALTV